MALNNSGPLSFGGSTVGQSINLELGVSATATASINSTAFRTLAGVPSGQISLNNFYGKSNAVPIAIVWQDASTTTSSFVGQVQAISSGSAIAATGPVVSPTGPNRYPVTCYTTAFGINYSKFIVGDGDSSATFSANRTSSKISLVQTQPAGGGFRLLEFTSAASTTPSGVSATGPINAIGSTVFRNAQASGADSSGNIYFSITARTNDVCCQPTFATGLGKIDLASNIIRMSGPANWNGVFMSPIAFAVSSAGDSYIVNSYSMSGNGSIAVEKINTSGVRQWGYTYTASAGVTGANNEGAVIILSSGNILFAVGTTLLQIDSNGNAVSGSFMGNNSFVKALAQDSGGNIYVFDNNSRLYKLNSSYAVQWETRLQFQVGSTGVGPYTRGQSFSFSSDGDLLFSGYFNGTGVNGDSFVMKINTSNYKLGTAVINGITFNVSSSSYVAPSSVTVTRGASFNVTWNTNTDGITPNIPATLIDTGWASYTGST
jgi:hypothetical protein